MEWVAPVKDFWWLFMVLLDVIAPTQSETINAVVAAVLQMLMAFGGSRKDHGGAKWLRQTTWCGLQKNN